MRRLTTPCSDDTAFAFRLSLKASTVMQNASWWFCGLTRPNPISASWLSPNWSASGPTAVDISRLVPLINDAARAYGLDPKLVHAVIRAESGYNTNAVSSKGAVGLMQLIPATAQRYGVQDSYDPGQNIQGGTRYLRDLLKMFNGNMELAIAGYNAGENAVIRAGHRIPPYPETMAYVPKVLSFYRSPDVSRF